MPKKLSEKRAPFVVTDPSMSRIIQQIYDDINEIVSAVNQSQGDDRDVAGGKKGDIRVVKRDHNDFRLETKTEDGWYATRPGIMDKLDKPNVENNTVSDINYVANLKNDWVNTERGWSQVGFYKLDDRVYLQGNIKLGRAGDDSVVFTLPEKYRPDTKMVFLQPCLFREKRVIMKSYFKNFGEIDDGNEKVQVATAKGAALGDLCIASINIDIQDMDLSCAVTAIDEITWVMSNHTGGAINLGDGTLRARIFKTGFHGRDALGLVHVDASGDVIIFSDNDSSRADNGISLDGISFKIRE